MAQALDRLLRFAVAEPVLLGSAVLLVMVVLCSTTVHLEEGWGWIDSVYFSVATLTTVGDPNLAPSHGATKVFLIFYLPLGIGVGFAVLSAFGARVLQL